jgi:hypothetical protein
MLFNKQKFSGSNHKIKFHKNSFTACIYKHSLAITMVCYYKYSVRIGNSRPRRKAPFFLLISASFSSLSLLFMRYTNQGYVIVDLAVDYHFLSQNFIWPTNLLHLQWNGGKINDVSKDVKYSRLPVPLCSIYIPYVSVINFVAFTPHGKSGTLL